MQDFCVLSAEVLAFLCIKFSILRKENLMKHYLNSSDEVLQGLRSDKNGLTDAEAERRRSESGSNKLAEPPKKSTLARFFECLKEPMILVLLAAAAVSLVLSIINRELDADVFIILFVVIMNSVIEVVQEDRANKALDALKAMTKAKCRCMRDGKLKVIDNEELVVGDIIHLEAGDAVPADARIIECASLKAEESALTGESVPVIKTSEALQSDGDIALGDRRNMVYMGSSIVYGRAVAVVTDIGMSTEMGRIAQALNDAKEEQTPLQLKLAQLSSVLMKCVLGICAFVLAFDIIRGVINGSEFFTTALSSLMIAVSLAVAAIPEGLSAVVTILLSIGVSKMAKQSAIIRKLSAVETLGCTQIICSDKTGTLTQNRMRVVDYVAAEKGLLATAMSLCNDASIDENGRVTGEPTEAALLSFGYESNYSKNDLLKDMPRVAEAPFDSERKMMSTLHSFEGGIVQYTKGAPDILLQKCSRIQTEKGALPLTDAIRQQIISANRDMADKALRVLAAAYKRYDSLPEFEAPSDIENNMIFIGLTGMIDPVRPEVKDAVQKCREAGIRPVMITGDHVDTAAAIGIELGIITDKSQAITGARLDTFSDEYLNDHIADYSVFARVQPEHKVRIVNAWKSKGKVVAMTGDGVNDAPSIKSADIGIGMGITGTDVTKGAADMILADDNFATIVSAAQEGRRIYDNIRKAIAFLLSSNLSEVITIFVATVFGFTVFKPAHILWINLITDTLPAISLGMEEAEGDVMKLPPRDKSEGIFAGHLGLSSVYQGILISILTLASYFIGEAGGNGQGMTMAFLTMSLCECFHAFNLRSIRHSAIAIKHQNKWLWISAAASLSLTALIIFVPPLRALFSLTVLDFWHYIVALLLSVSIIPAVECAKKIIARIYDKK